MSGLAAGLTSSCMQSEPTVKAARFQIGIQEYTFHRWLGKTLDHLDYPALCKEKLDISHIEYWSRAFKNQHTDKAYVDELVKRTSGEGLTNVLILVDVGNQLDSADKAERDRSLEEHKAWVECATMLGCRSIRVNCFSGGDPAENMANAVDGVSRLCDFAADTGVKIVIEPHGKNSQDPDWLVGVMKALNHPAAGLLPDFNNFGKYDRYEAMAKCLPYAQGAICAKSVGFDPSGNDIRTDYHRMLKIVHDSDFTGVITVEYEGKEPGPLEGAYMTRLLIESALQNA